jgi:AcrR family transcriptional regulator
LRAARECFARTGYAGTTNKQIGDHAGITAAAIYQYFDSKTALYMATVRDAQSELVPRFREAVAGERTTRGAFRALLAASAVLHERDPSLAAFLSALPVELRREDEIANAMAEAPSEVLAIMEGIVARGVRAREITPATAPHVLSMFLACTMGLSLYAASFGADEYRAALDAFLALIDGTLLHDRGPARAPSRRRDAPSPKPSRGGRAPRDRSPDRASSRRR